MISRVSRERTKSSSPTSSNCIIIALRLLQSGALFRLYPKGYGSTHKLRLRWEVSTRRGMGATGKPPFEIVGAADTFYTKAILSHFVKEKLLICLLEKPFRLFFVKSIELCYSLPHTSRQAASGLRKASAVLFKGEAPLAGLPLLKKCPPDTFSIHPFRAPPVFFVGAPLRTRLCLVLWSGLCPNTPPASGARLDRALFNYWRTFSALLC